mmetsp:Transcript_100474/g.161994  ORF Transcript_100474/g.161994 Transcript_100474/m.161994 type:complete len:157 (-) Transcript_100474:666-1136(-)
MGAVHSAEEPARKHCSKNSVFTKTVFFGRISCFGTFAKNTRQPLQNFPAKKIDRIGRKGVFFAFWRVAPILQVQKAVDLDVSCEEESGKALQKSIFPQQCELGPKRLRQALGLFQKKISFRPNVVFSRRGVVKSQQTTTKQSAKTDQCKLKPRGAH